MCGRERLLVLHEDQTPPEGAARSACPKIQHIIMHRLFANGHCQ